MNARTRWIAVVSVLALAALALLVSRGGESATGARVERRAESPTATPSEAAELSAPEVGVRASSPQETPAPAEVEAPAAAAPEPAVDAEDGAPGPGCIRVVVTRDGARMPQQTILVERTRNNWLFAEALEGDAAQRVLTDAAGEVEVCGLEPGSHVVALLEPAGGTHQGRAELGEDEGAVVEIELGTGRLFGTVIGEDGAPVEGACVSIWRRASRGGLALAFTDAQGRYDVDGLGDGTLQASAYFDGNTYGQRQDAKTVTLEAGEERELDLGVGPDVFTWTGTVRTTWGAPVTAAGSSRVGLSFVPTVGGALWSAKVDADGRFEVRLREGTYAPLVTPPGHPSRIRLQEPFEVGETDGVRDIVLPGSRLEGRVTAGPDGAPPNAPERSEELVVRIHLDGHTYPAAFYDVPVGPDGRYAFDGLEPGDWRVGMGREPLTSFRTLRIEPGADRVTLDLSPLPR
ncbi:MAG: carboxypeptidase regulatory-like domain-containing protein [Planctomycetota bacterium]